jgi:hypothetical protein
MMASAYCAGMDGACETPSTSQTAIDGCRLRSPRAVCKDSDSIFKQPKIVGWVEPFAKPINRHEQQLMGIVSLHCCPLKAIIGKCLTVRTPTNGATGILYIL